MTGGDSPEEFFSKSNPSTFQPKKKKKSSSREVEMVKLPLYKASPEKRSASVSRQSYRESSDSDEDMKSKPKRASLNPKAKSLMKLQKGAKKMTPEKKKENIKDIMVKMPNRMKKFARTKGDLDLCHNYEDDLNTTLKCPISHHCTSELKMPYSKELQILYDRIKLMENEHKQGLVDQSAVVKAKDMFCEWHKAEIDLIPEGIEKGYRKDIDFVKIPERLHKAKKRLYNPHHRFESIIKGTTKSTFRAKALAQHKLKKASGNDLDNETNSISSIGCGYYGWTGMSVIYKIMLDMFTGPKSILTTKTAYPQTITDFIQHVLVPEAALLLIAQDQNWDLDIKNQGEDAMFMMEESEEWGALVHSEVLKEQIIGEAFS